MEHMPSFKLFRIRYIVGNDGAEISRQSCVDATNTTTFVEIICTTSLFCLVGENISISIEIKKKQILISI